MLVDEIVTVWRRLTTRCSKKLRATTPPFFSDSVRRRNPGTASPVPDDLRSFFFLFRRAQFVPAVAGVTAVIDEAGLPGDLNAKA